MRVPLTLAILAALSAPAYAVEVDGRVDPAEWQGARHITDFRKVQPLSLDPASLPTEAWILATPEGLAIAFRNEQPASVPRTRQRVQRDFEEQVDRVNLMIDYDGDGRTGYNFTVSSTDGIADAVITNESQFNDDWDGNWRHAVSEDEQNWYVEMLIPWYIAPMRQGDNGMRTVKIYLDRVIGSTGERSAWPGASFQRSRFLSDFAPVEMAQYSQSLLAVTPYVSGLYDNVNHSSDFDGGVDLFWKPNGQFQLSATLNPDFGQVESDDLVVNFDATEIFISDKRPFFTENQGIFEFTTPSDYSQLLYTRRVGGPADDGNGAGDITAAVKLNGSVGGTKYGVFAADEADEVGRTFGALRVVRDLDKQNLGAMVTHVDRPFLDRDATVLGVDHNWRPTQRWNVQTRLIGSQVDESGRTTDDTGATMWVNYEMDHGWRQRWLAMHFGNELEINDFGYLQRNSTNYLNYEVLRRFTDLPETSRYSSKDWRGRISGTDNDHGDRLQRQLRISREGNLRNGSYEYAQININSAGIDDLITRGNGLVDKPPNFNAYFEFNRPRKGDWAWEFEADLFSGGLAGNDKIGYDLRVQPTYFISDAFSVYLGGYYERIPSWLVWQQDNLIGEFDEERVQLDAGMDWTITNKQELRVKLQAIGLNADLEQAYRVAQSGASIPTADAVDDFSVSNLGFQIRYRYELAPLSYLYVVYGRGGFDQQPFGQGADRALRDSLELRDDEQLLVKLSYRLEL
ncbi:DUF5916 domain-containing protein [Lysobacter sp. LF1]|uniref:DUF5916 domain-containing protein n=1 Tax=Lysobacter stagni TaxID=3045172 RepID=A0ABT6XK80_9GAMM|nr:DUF5916 domain-containing protein [Lysobacter sp. LF1]MDI9240577.1 DUF5916 domain-containing protein [Lysobacter sp. LF1]